MDWLVHFFKDLVEILQAFYDSLKWFVRIFLLLFVVVICTWVLYALLFDESKFGDLMTAINHKSTIAVDRADSLANAAGKAAGQVEKVRKAAGK